MSHYMQQPENVYKRAKELTQIPNVDAAVLRRSKRTALELLHEAIVAKKTRTWQPAHEQLMILFLDICLDLQLGRVAKDGFHQYRNLAIQHNPASLETVVKYFVQKTEANLAKAKRECNTRILQAAAAIDLEASQTPEAVMLSTTTFDSSSDRTDREVVVPWLRFTWEAYRTVLDILKNNSRLEKLYKTTTLQAFDFCVEYTRKIEFRRLCEILRNHLGALQKHVSAPTSQSTRQMRAWEGFTLESVELLLEVRYRQLHVALQLDLYSEAFRTIDDINNIMHIVDQVPRLDLLVTYYEKLAQIFLVSKNFLFHACALFKTYLLRVSGLAGLDGPQALHAVAPLIAIEEQKQMATKILLAALSIPLVDFDAAAAVLENDDTSSGAAATSSAAEPNHSVASREKNSRMAALLGYAVTPTRAQLLETIDAAGIVSLADADIATLFQLVERQEVNPLQIVQQVLPYLEKLRAYPSESPFAGYADSVERLIVRRVLFQLSRIYSSITIAHLRSIFVGLNVSYEEIEQLIVRSRSLSMVAHASAPSLTSLYLKDSLSRGGASSTATASAAASALRTRIRIDHVEQCVRFSDAVELEANPTQLSLLGERLSKVLNKVRSPQVEADAAKQRAQLFAQTRERLNDTRSSMLGRREIIEHKKEELEKLQQEKQKALEQRRLEEQQRLQQQEKERLEQEAKRRELERKQRIKEEIALKETRAMLEKIGHKDIDSLDLENIDRDQLVNEAKEKAQKAKEEAQRKLRESAKRLDYITRATRETEQPVLQELFAKEKEDAKEQYAKSKAAKLQQAQEQHTFSLEEKRRLAPALQVTADFVARHKERRLEQYKKASEEQKKKAMLERLEQRVAHASERYEEEQAILREKQAEEERLHREEEERREQERQAEVEAELRRQEEEEKRQKDEEERLARDEEARAREEHEREMEKEREQRKEHERGGRFESGAYRPPVRAAAEGNDDGEWTHVGVRGSARPAPQGRWERAGPMSRDSDHEGGFRRSFGADRDREDRGDDDARPRRFGGDREGGDREGGGLRRFGGDRDRDEDARPRRFGGDREGGDREGGFRRFGGDRDREERGAWRRGGDREGGDREGGGFRRFGGDRDREGGDREGGFRRGSDREGGDREGGFRRGGDREGGDREGGFRRGGDREGGDREGGFRRGGDREGGDREGGLRRGGDREGGDREGGLRRGGDRDREGGERGEDDRFFGRGREGSYRPPRAGGDRWSRDREPARAPESGRWR